MRPDACCLSNNYNINLALHKTSCFNGIVPKENLCNQINGTKIVAVMAIASRKTANFQTENRPGTHPIGRGLPCFFVGRFAVALVRARRVRAHFLGKDKA